MAWIWAFMGNKGGPGKTAESVGTAYALAEEGYEVGFADMDAQGNATRRLGIDKAALVDADRPGIAELLDPKRPAPIREVAVPCGWPEEAAKRITVLPSIDRESLSERNEEAAKPGAATRLRRALESDGWADERHAIVIDCGPDVNHLLLNALVAADRVVLVTALNKDSIEGAVFLADWIERTKVTIERPDLEIAGVVVNAYNDEAARQVRHYEALPRTFERWGGADLIWQPPVPHRISLANVHDDALPVSTIRHVSVHDLAPAYRAHANRIIAVQKGSA